MWILPPIQNKYEKIKNELNLHTTNYNKKINFKKYKPWSYILEGSIKCELYLYVILGLGMVIEPPCCTFCCLQTSRQSPIDSWNNYHRLICWYLKKKLVESAPVSTQESVNLYPWTPYATGVIKTLYWIISQFDQIDIYILSFIWFYVISYFWQKGSCFFSCKIFLENGNLKAK